MSNKTLYVGNLAYNATQEDLRDHFAPYEPSEIRIIGDKGFGFVDVPAEKAAEAIAATNSKEIRGRQIRVDEARPRSSGGTGARTGGYGRGPSSRNRY
ncbi:MAG: RNA-binding protein [Acidobacteriota bacterium]